MGNPSDPRYRPVEGQPPLVVNDAETLRQQHVAWLRRQETAHVVIVCGGRNYADRARVFAALDRAHAKRSITLLVHGGAPGADTLAGEWAKARGVWVEVFEANWRELGPKAGPERNARMVAAGAHGCIAFPGGRGTADNVKRCEAAGIPVWRPFG
jgi:predicted Rossmann-fold nucleotide-binding protein